MELPSLPKPRQDNSAPTVYAEMDTYMCINLVPGGARTHELKIEADALPTKPQLYMTALGLIAECDRNAAMRFTANKIVAFSAITKLA